MNAVRDVGPAGATSAPRARNRFLNRELSTVDFNARVLALAEDRSIPLLERAKFLAIFASNMDEFFQVRVAGLKQQVEAGIRTRSSDGLTPREALSAIAAKVVPLAEQHAQHVRRGREARARGRGREGAALARARGGSARRAERDVPREDLPRADAPGGGLGAPVPVHLEPVAEPCRAGPRPGREPHALRAHQGAAAAAAVRGVLRGPLLRSPRGGDRREPRSALPRHGDRRAPHLPRDAQRRPRDRRPRGRPARGARGGALQAPRAAGRAARGRADDPAARARAADERARGRTRRTSTCCRRRSTSPGSGACTRSTGRI